MVVSRRALLLAGAAIPTAAYGQCVINAPAVDACLGGVRNAGPAGATLDLNFMFPGSLDPRITFTRASTATYTDASGVIQTAAVNQPRWDYAGGSLRGLLIEEARTNLMSQSGNLANAVWQLIGGTSAAPVATANQVTAPDGTLTAARIVFPAVSAAGAFSIVAQGYTGTATPNYAYSIWMRGAVGGEQIYLIIEGGYYGSAPRITLTTQWQRYTLPNLGVAVGTWYLVIGTDLRDATQTSTPGGTIYAWGGQVEAAPFVTSYIPTAAAPVSRSADLVTMPFTPAASGTYVAKFIPAGAAASLPVILGGNAGSPNMSIGADSRLVANVRSGAVVFSGVAPALTFNAVNKTAFGWLTGASKAAVNGTLLGANAVALAVTGTVLQFGSDGVTPGNNALNGGLQGVQYWPRQLSDAELQQVTT